MHLQVSYLAALKIVMMMSPIKCIDSPDGGLERRGGVVEREDGRSRATASAQTHLIVAWRASLDRDGGDSSPHVHGAHEDSKDIDIEERDGVAGSKLWQACCLSRC